MYWKKWAAKHEYEELQERVWIEPLRKKVRESIALWPARSSCKEDGRKRDFSILAGRM